MAADQKYEKLYKESLDICGPPFAPFVTFFASLAATPISVLDLGCGQGRDALVVARLGHQVHGVDIAPTGIAQMLAAAAAAGLSVTGEVADLVSYRPADSYEMVIIDRVLHMLADDGARRHVLAMAADCTRPAGHLLLADTATNMPLLTDFFLKLEEKWLLIRQRKNYLIAQKRPD